MEDTPKVRDARFDEARRSLGALSGSVAKGEGSGSAAKDDQRDTYVLSSDIQAEARSALWWVEETSVYHLTKEQILKVLGLDDTWRLERVHPSTRFDGGAAFTVVREMK